jgi:hypothetical protein
MASISSTMLEVIDITKVGQYILRFVLWLNIYEHTSLSNKSNLYNSYIGKEDLTFFLWLRSAVAYNKVITS